MPWQISGIYVASLDGRAPKRLATADTAGAFHQIASFLSVMDSWLPTPQPLGGRVDGRAVTLAASVLMLEGEAPFLSPPMAAWPMEPGATLDRS